MKRRELTPYDRLRLWVYNTFGPGEINIYLVRHGESEGNVNPDKYLELSDPIIALTPKGIEQAKLAGAFLAQHLYERYKKDPKKFKHVRFIYSPYKRARQTTYYFLRSAGEVFGRDRSVISYLERALLFEQQAGKFDGMNSETFAIEHPEDAAYYKKLTSLGGKFYAPVALGENQVVTAMRSNLVLRSVVDDYRTRKKGLFSVGRIPNIVISTHGATMKTLIMSWMGYSPEWIACERTPTNCAIRRIHGSQLTGYIDEGYIYGEDLPLHDPSATQKPYDFKIDDVAVDPFMLKPQRSRIVTPPGLKLYDPFEGLPS